LKVFFHFFHVFFSENQSQTLWSFAEFAVVVVVCLREKVDAVLYELLCVFHCLKVWGKARGCQAYRKVFFIFFMTQEGASQAPLASRCQDDQATLRTRRRLRRGQKQNRILQRMRELEPNGSSRGVLL